MSQASIATLILNRNLPDATDQLVDHFRKWDDKLTDIYVIESGSDKDKLSRHCSFWANWPEALENGLRWARGFNYGLLELDRTGRRYEYYFLVMGDSVFEDQPTLNNMLAIMEQYSRIGILSPLSSAWSEAKLLAEGDDVKCFWLFPHVSWLVRRSLLDLVITKDQPSYINYFYDGGNFRGYYDDIELIAKAYHRDYAAAITSRVIFREDEELARDNIEQIKTDEQSFARRQMYEDGLVWMRQKYGFIHKGQFKEWVEREYRDFMRRNPEYQQLAAGVQAKQGYTYTD